MQDIIWYSIFYALSSYIPDILVGLILIITKTYVVEGTGQVHRLDSAISKNALWCARRQVGSSRLPADGLALFWWGFAWRLSSEKVKNIGSTKWTIYSLFGMSYAIQKAAGLSSLAEVTDCQIEIAGPWHSSVSKAPLSQNISNRTPLGWQNEVCEKLTESFLENGRGSVYVWGKPNTGKSALGPLIASELVRVTGGPVILVRGFDLCAKGILISDAINFSEMEMYPHVLVFDEYDGAVDQADMNEQEMSESRSIASTKTNLLTTIDRLVEKQNLIIIATGNPPPAAKNTPKECYYRTGRFDLTFESQEF